LPNAAEAQLAKATRDTSLQQLSELGWGSIAKDKNIETTRQQTEGQDPPPEAMQGPNRLCNRLTGAAIVVEGPPGVAKAEVDQGDRRFFTGRRLLAGSWEIRCHGFLLAA
jgi:hypothetical protein